MRLTGLGTASIVTIPTDTPLGLFAATIQQVEGYYPGSLAYRNNNPGNLRLDSGGYYASAFGAKPGAGGYAAFPTLDAGTAALFHQIQVDAGRGLTITQMMNKYAPSGDGNNPSAYAQTLANALGVTVGTLVRDAISGTGTGTGTGAASTPIEAQVIPASVPVPAALAPLPSPDSIGPGLTPDAYDFFTSALDSAGTGTGTGTGTGISTSTLAILAALASLAALLLLPRD